MSYIFPFPPLLRCSRPPSFLIFIVAVVFCLIFLFPVLPITPILLSLYSNQNNLKAQNQIILLVLNPSVASHCKWNQPNIASPATYTGGHTCWAHFYCWALALIPYACAFSLHRLVPDWHLSLNITSTVTFQGTFLRKPVLPQIVLFSFVFSTTSKREIIC